jgi:hypothetical protein
MFPRFMSENFRFRLHVEYVRAGIWTRDSEETCGNTANVCFCLALCATIISVLQWFHIVTMDFIQCIPHMFIASSCALDFASSLPRD